MTRLVALFAFLVALILAPDTPRASIRSSPSVDAGTVHASASWTPPAMRPTLGRAGYGLTLADAAPPAPVFTPTIAPDGTLAADPSDDLGKLALVLLKAVQDRNWWLVVSLVLSLVLAGVRKIGPGLLEGRWPAGAAWLKSDVGGAVLVLGLGILGGIATALAGGAPIGAGLLIDALKVSLGSAGGFVLVKKLFGFSSAKVEAAGQAAVDKSPPAGVAGVTGPTLPLGG